MSQSTPPPSTAIDLRAKRANLTESLVTRAMSTALRTIDRQRFASMIMLAFGKIKNLDQCTPASLAMTFSTCAQLGFYPGDARKYIAIMARKARYQGPNGEWIDGYEAGHIIQYQGLAELARRHPDVLDVNAIVVLRGQPHRLRWTDRGLDLDLEVDSDVPHEDITPDTARERIVGAYAVVTLKGGGRTAEWLTIGQIEARRQRGASGTVQKFGRNAGERTNTPWETDYESMARKSVLRAVLGGGLVPLSLEAAAAMSSEDDIEIEEAHASPAVTAAPAAKRPQVMAWEDEAPAIAADVIDAEPEPAKPEPVAAAVLDAEPVKPRTRKAAPVADDDGMPS